MNQRRSDGRLIRTNAHCPLLSPAHQRSILPGARAKVAERIVRELRDKNGGLMLTLSERMIVASADGYSNAGSLMDGAISALLNRRYKPVPLLNGPGDVHRRVSAILSPIVDRSDQIEVRPCNIRSYVVSLLKQEATSAGHFGELR
jgi:hypothetical protein